MKKVILIALVLFGTAIFFGSCSGSHSCAAYNHVETDTSDLHQ